MNRIAIGIEYDGTRYHGWQTQRDMPRLVTIQETVEAALSKVAAQPLTVICAGRTDVGVHAIGQVAHFNTTSERTMRAWVMGGNHCLPPDIRLHWARPVTESFHARFSAKARSYRYIIYNHRANNSALWRDRAFWFTPPLDTTKMQLAANYLIGEHDFSSFRASSCQSQSTKRNVEQIIVQKLEQKSIAPLFLPSSMAPFIEPEKIAESLSAAVTPESSHIITIDITANAFLHHMVRNIVGTLIMVGTAQKEPAWIKEVLAARNRVLAGITAPANGLYLMGVRYT